MSLLIYLINLGFDIYIGIIVVQIAISWLVIFGIINTGNAQAQNLMRLLARATDPLYKPLRRYIPSIGGIDISPIIIILGLSFARDILIRALLSI